MSSHLWLAVLFHHNAHFARLPQLNLAQYLSFKMVEPNKYHIMGCRATVRIVNNSCIDVIIDAPIKTEREVDGIHPLAYVIIKVQDSALHGRQTVRGIFQTTTTPQKQVSHVHSIVEKLNDGEIENTVKELKTQATAICKELKPYIPK